MMKERACIGCSYPQGTLQAIPQELWIYEEEDDGSYFLIWGAGIYWGKKCLNRVQIWEYQVEVNVDKSLLRASKIGLREKFSSNLSSNVHSQET